MKINTSPESSAQEEIPQTNAKLRIKKEPTFSLSQSSGDKMLQFQFEVSDPPEVVDANGVSIPLSGLEITQYLMLEGGGAFRFNEFMQALRDNGNDLPVDVEIDDETGLPVDIAYQGLECWAVIATETQKIAIGKGKDAPKLLNPLTGKPQVSSRLNIKRFITTKS